MEFHLGKCSSILLLGEANFSFSLSLAKLLPSSVSMTTTCLESEDNLSRSDNGHIQDNIRSLQEYGIRVLFGVDATNLDNCGAIEGAQFDGIIFNFPHVGGKSNIAKNRELLRKFFTCCPQFLSSDGQVFVTLCKGQGGTPADNPQRKWNDSWQIVAMATYGSLILTKTEEFDSTKYADYDCTGYRNQKKGFLTAGGITHIFERGLPVSVEDSTSQISTQLTLGVHGRQEEILAECPPDIAGKVERDHLSKSSHPLHHAMEDLRQAVVERFTDVNVIPHTDQPLAVPLSDVVCTNQLSSSIYTLEYASSGKDDEYASICTANEYANIQNQEESALTEKSVASSVNTHTSDSSAVMENPTLPDQRSSESHEYSADGDLHENMKTPKRKACSISSQGGDTVLRPNLLHHIQEILDRKCVAPCIMFGRVFQRSSVDATNYPIMHHCLLLFPACHGADALWEGIEHTYCKLVEGVLGINEQVLTSAMPAFDERLGDMLTLSVEMEQPNHLEQCSVNIGYCGTFHAKEGVAKFCVIYVDAVAIAKYAVEDVRLLWSRDDRIFKNFENNQKNADICHESQSLVKSKPKCTFQGLSIYPPTYTHDVSFWVKEELFDEQQLYSVIRSVTFDLIKEVKYLDLYDPKDNTFVSYLYRLVYQSCDRAMSKEVAARLQSKVRYAIHIQLEGKVR